MQSAPEKLRHSGWGKASCLMLVAEVGVYLLVELLILLDILGALKPLEFRTVVAATDVLFYLIVPVLSLVGVVLGFKGVFQKDRRKVLAYLGLATNGLILASFVPTLLSKISRSVTSGGS